MVLEKNTNSAADANCMSNVITGFHSIEEKVKAAQKNQNASQFKIYYAKAGPRVKKIITLAQETGIQISNVHEKKLDELVQNLDVSLRDHRGIVMIFSSNGEKNKSSNIVDFDAWVLQNSDESEVERKTVVVLDKVTDPHNVGAIIRSCDQFGANLVVLPEHNSASDIGGNEIIGRTSAGSSAWVPVSVVNNLVRAVEKLKSAGFWIYGADAGGETLGKITFPKKTCLIMGSEGSGISNLLQQKCDSIVSIPTCGKIDSLNVSVAAGVLLYELFARQN